MDYHDLIMTYQIIIGWKYGKVYKKTLSKKYRVKKEAVFHKNTRK